MRIAGGTMWFSEHDSEEEDEVPVDRGSFTNGTAVFEFVWNPLRHNSLAPERASVLVDHRAVALELLVERDAVVWQPQQPGEPPLAVLDRLGPNVLAVHLEQIERTQHGAGVGAMPAD